MGSEIYPEVHENPRVFFSSFSPILLEPLAHGSSDWSLPREDCITSIMGIADAILDIVSNGTTLRENNLKEIKGGVVLESQVVFIASRKSMIQQKGVLETTQEMLERLEAHLRAIG
ncbi:ATP phosphoribosyltransferase 2, chloroplastic [Glycine soja]|uniref:ATP phosphoribosyltransferase n=1 Tax=Glycine soja TaxID=3848 RepID=A0A445H5Q7_GLYSO|nr:ATP phosphoribosyltransferase 2, chloroplastic [Glycine soja]